MRKTEKENLKDRKKEMKQGAMETASFNRENKTEREIVGTLSHMQRMKRGTKKLFKRKYGKILAKKGNSSERKN